MRDERLLRRVSRVLVAISGGPDSLALLLILRELRQELGFELEGCHFDHQLRPDSRADLDRVRAICGQLGIECVTGEGDVRSVATENRASIEDTARKMRYQFLGFVAEKERCDCVATGHTANDQAETVLMRILRGSGVRGVRGMLPKATVPGAGERSLIRPLLGLTRVETRAICMEAGITPIDDPSNTDLTVLRNRLRLETLPLLEAINPSVQRSLLGLAASAREVFDGVERESFGVQPLERVAIGAIFDLGALRALRREARTLVIEREAAFYQLQPEINRTRISNLVTVLERGRGEVRFGDTTVEVSARRVRIGPALEEAEEFDTRILNVPGATIAGPWRVDVRTEPLPEVAGALSAPINSDQFQGALRVRIARASDRMMFRGLERSVREVLATVRVPRWERMGVVAIADGSRIHALFTASGVITAHPPGDDPLFVRVGAAG